MILYKYHHKKSKQYKYLGNWYTCTQITKILNNSLYHKSKEKQIGDQIFSNIF